MKEKKGFKMPDTYVLIVFLIIIMCLLTHVIPAGQYDMVEGTKMVVAGSYHNVDPNPAGILDFLNCFMGGLQSGATTIFLVFLIGGAFQILMDTGSVDAMLALALNKSKGNYAGIIATIAVVMSILGALGVGNNVALAFIPIMVILCRKLRLDSIVVVGIMYFASNLGFSGSPMNPFTVLLAQDIADVQQMSGFVPRCLMWLVFTVIGTIWIVRYCRKIHNSPEKSITGIYELTDEDISDMEKIPEVKPTHFINMGILVIVFGVYAYGGIKYNWDISVLGAAMMVLGFLTGIVGRMSPDQMAKSFVAGAKTMVYSAMLIGFASGINVIMTNASIIHTVIYYLTLPLLALPQAISAVGMFIANFIFNFFVSSGSGQCYVVMPLMAPAADVLDLTRQVAISAFQYGDGLCNVVIPTSGLLMGSLGAAKVPFDKWLKFAFPVTMVCAAAASIFLVIMTLIGWA